MPAFTPLSPTVRQALRRDVFVPMLNRLMSRMPERRARVRDILAKVSELYVTDVPEGDIRWKELASILYIESSLEADAGYGAATSAYHKCGGASNYYAEDAAISAEETKDDEYKKRALDIAAAGRAAGLDLASRPVSQNVLEAVTGGIGKINQDTWHTCDMAHLRHGTLPRRMAGPPVAEWLRC